MTQKFKGWNTVSENLCLLAKEKDPHFELNDGQKASLQALAKRLPKNGVIIADEVGMGKTRIAVAVARSVIQAGGRVAILVPPTLGYQWNDELHLGMPNVDMPPILRNFKQYLLAYQNQGANASWFMKSAVVISHSFTTWRLGTNAKPWRWSLLPELNARWQKTKHGRWPNHYLNHHLLEDELVRQAAESILKNILAKPKTHPLQKSIQELVNTTPWKDSLKADEYESGQSSLRPQLEQAVGLGLGVFDLVIIDEAHKSRKDNSQLNQLLDNVILQNSVARRLAMTATPVELEATQWIEMLERIKVNHEAKKAVDDAINKYSESVSRVKEALSNREVRKDFYKSSKVFKERLDDYVLRRDKREDPAVIKFKKASGEAYHAYRHEKAIEIDTVALTDKWKQAVCAAEALSFVANQSDDVAAKRQRLTLGNGHGVAKWLDECYKDNKEDKEQIEEDSMLQNDQKNKEATEVSSASKNNKEVESKRRLRIEWWQAVLKQPFSQNDGSVLFDHPAILAATKEIEAVCEKGEKVLVFGRFTHPLRALVQLLNAREMLQRIDSGQPWPQSKVHEDDNWNAVLAAHKQLKRRKKLSLDSLNKTLAKQYKILENDRHSFRRHLIESIEKGFLTLKKKPDQRTQGLFNEFKKEVTEQNDSHILVTVAKAIQEMIGTNFKNPKPVDLSGAFIDLIMTAFERDEGDADGDGKLNDKEASNLWKTLKLRLDHEYNRPEGGFARLMNGETPYSTRRFLQLGFNRETGHPKVLVAQSLVGREGLNLHEACRTVVLLHPEWNPGIVEQQIGRVDRIGSLWEKKLKQVTDKNGKNAKVPRIEILSVIFKGTYDEKNWEVLHDRWDDLRAQLHGIVIPPRIAENYPDKKKLIQEINDAAPTFRP